MVAQVISRIIAVLLISIAVGIMVYDSDQADGIAQDAYSDLELRADLAANRLPSRELTVFYMTIVVGGSTILVEGISWLLRRVPIPRKAPANALMTPQAE